MSPYSVMHALYHLADYPVLATLARERTTASKLDGRACLHLYKEALPRMDWQALSAQERAFMLSLGITMTVAELIASLQTFPPELPIMLQLSEGGVDYANEIRVTDVAQHSIDWSGTPIGRYCELPHHSTSGPPFSVVLIALHSEMT